MDTLELSIGAYTKTGDSFEYDYFVKPYINGKEFLAASILSPSYFFRHSIDFLTNGEKLVGLGEYFINIIIENGNTSV